ncbi:hypothetical protein, partial [Aeromonas caviae]
GVFGDSQFTSTLSVNFHFPKIPRRTYFFARMSWNVCQTANLSVSPEPSQKGDRAEDGGHFLFFAYVCRSIYP